MQKLHPCFTAQKLPDFKQTNINQGRNFVVVGFLIITVKSNSQHVLNLVLSAQF